MKVSHHGISRLRFGQFEVDLLEGKLFHRDAPVRIENQPFQILVALLERPGEIVDRDELRNRLWPSGTYVDFDEGVNTAISKLRYALHDSTETPVFVETVPRRGYRFLAPISDVTAIEATPRNVNHDTAPATPEPETKPAKPLWWKRRATVAVAACVVVAGVLYLWIAPRIEKQRRQSELERMTVLPLTTLPGGVWYASFSPDGREIAFSQGDSSKNDEGYDLYVQVIGGDKTLRLTNRDFGILGLAWSPDGKNIALWRAVQDNQSGIYLISPLGGPQRKVASVHGPHWYGNKVAWSPDSKQLAFVDAPADPSSGGTDYLFRLSLDSLERTRVKSNCKLVANPAFSPRGDYLAWSCPENMSHVSVELERLRDGRVTQLLRDLDGVGGLAWSGDGRRIIYSTGYTGGDLWEVALDRPDRPEKLPFGHDASDIAVSAAGNRLAFNQNHSNINIWRLGLSDPQPRAERLLASSREQTAAKYSPDGTQIVFHSNRTGNYEIWVSDADGSNLVQLTSFGVRQTGSPSWSPDGKRIAFDSRRSGEATIYIVDPRGGVPKKLNVDVNGNCLPVWSHDGAWIYFVNGADAQHASLWKVPSEGGHAVQVAQYPAAYPVESPDGQYIYFNRNGHLWLVNVDGTDEQQVQGMSHLCLVGDGWVPFGSRIYFRGCESDGEDIDYLDLETHKVKLIYKLQKPASEYTGGLSVSPDGKYLLYPQVDELASNLMLVENWR